MNSFDEASDNESTEWEEEIENECAKNEFITNSHDTSGSESKPLNILVPKAQSKKRRNFYDKAVVAREKEQRIQVHKVHLLCLLAHAMITSELCNHQLIQSLMVSMVPPSLALADYATTLGKNILSRLLKWFSFNVDILSGVLSQYSNDWDDKATLLYDVLLFVSILRGLGIRTRVVLSFKVVPYRSYQKQVSSISEQSNAHISSTAQCDDKNKEDSSGSKATRVRKNRSCKKESSVNQATSPYFRRKRASCSPVSDSRVEESCGSGYWAPCPKRPKHSESFDCTGMTSTAPDSNRTDNQLLYGNSSSWVEVYLDRKWVCLHIPSMTVDQPSICEKQCPYKFDYVIGIDNNGYISDVTGRYASQWCTTVLKNRIDLKWWNEVLYPYAPPSRERELEEEDISGILSSQPLPTVISEYKRHPLYVLKRHLSKFEVIYPEDSEKLGHFKNEPVYSRSCVHTLHTRETWLKEARLVRQKEKPFKVVKGRKRKGQSSTDAEDNKAELFGLWQTEEYIPPPVVDGKVTRNEFGNIELFKPSMLPAGAVHLNFPGIAKVARKLNIDYAPAMMGWNHCGRQCHPIIEGIVVAKEYHNTLMEAWSQEQQIIIEKDIKKKSKQAIERWIKLTKGLIIRERVREKFLLVNAFQQ